jgi:hypothetical protein
MICLDCNRPIRANAKRCTLCSARHYMETRSLPKFRHPNPKKAPETKEARRDGVM